MMLKTLMLKEFMGMVLDRKYLVYFCLVTVLAVAGFAVRVTVYRDRHDNYLTLQNTFAHDAQQAGSIQQLAMGGLKVSVPPQPLQTLAQGTADRFSEFANISLAYWNKEPFPFLRTERYTNPALDIFPALDVPMLILFIVSLMVLVFSHGTVSRERESGTLRLLFSYRVPRAKVILAKTVSGYLVTAFPVAFSLVCVLLAAQLIPSFGFDGRSTLLVLAMGALSLLYLLVLYLLGVFVSTVCNRSSTAVAVLLLVWLVFIVVTHNTAILAYEKSARNASVARVLRDKEKPENRMALFAEMNGVPHQVLGLEKGAPIDWKSITPVQQMAIARKQVQLLNAELTGTVDDYINELERNYRMLTLAGFASPSLLYLAAATELAGTGIDGHIRILRSLTGYQQRLTDMLDGVLDRLITTAARGEPGEEPGIDVALKDLGPYRAPEPALKNVLSGLFPQVLALCVYAVLFFLMGFTAFIKKEIT